MSIPALKAGICVIILAFIMIFTGCGSNPEEGPLVFRYRLATDPPTIDPIHCTDTSSATIVLKIFEGLVDQDPATLEVVPAIAERWEITGDGLTYTFHLKRGVLFHNGREVTSQDFRYSFERCLRRKKPLRTKLGACSDKGREGNDGRRRGDAGRHGNA